MYLKSKNAPLLILGITAVVCSRAMFFFINDPEGPNLLVVLGAATIVYLLSLAAYAPGFQITGPRRLVSAILIQILLVAGFYFFLG